MQTKLDSLDYPERKIYFKKHFKDAIKNLELKLFREKSDNIQLRLENKAFDKRLKTGIESAKQESKVTIGLQEHELQYLRKIKA